MTNTFRAAGTTNYQPVVDGAIYGRFGLQVVTMYPVSVFIGTAAPVDNTEDFISMSAIGTREIVASLGSTDKVYVRTSEATSIAVRGFRESRT